MENIERIIWGEKRVPEIDLSRQEMDMAYIGCVMSKFILEMDFDQNLYYSLNPESSFYVEPVFLKRDEIKVIKTNGVQAALHPFNARSDSTPRGRRP